MVGCGGSDHFCLKFRVKLTPLERIFSRYSLITARLAPNTFGAWLADSTHFLRPFSSLPGDNFVLPIVLGVDGATDIEKLG